MRSLYSILESIADDDDIKINQSLGDAIIDQLIDSGIYYAKGEYNGSKYLSENFVKYVDGELYFYDDDSGYGCSVCIDCRKANNSLKTIKAIHAPIVYFLQSDEAITDLPKVYGLRAVIKDAPKSIDNFDFKYEHIVDDFIDWSGVTINKGCFKQVAHYNVVTTGVYIESYHSSLHLVNCNFKGDLKNTCILNLHCEDVKFSNVKCDFHFASIYDPSLFGSGCDMSAKLDKVFDPIYKFTMIGEMDKNNSIRVDRKTKNFDSIIAYFNNRKNKLPESFPYKVIGKLSDVLDVKGFSNSSLGIQLRNNNVLVEFTRVKSRADSIMKTDKAHYSTDGHNLPNNCEMTKDGFYVVFAKRP